MKNFILPISECYSILVPEIIKFTKIEAGAEKKVW